MASRFNHELLRQVRVELDLSQDQLAESVGIDVRTYRRYESGAVNDGGFAIRRGSQRKLVRDLCECLGLSESELVVTAPGTATGSFVPRRVHALPRTARFVGRAAELAELSAWLDVDDVDATRVVAIVGMGGTGKSTLVGRALSRFGDESLAHGLLVWSFYDNPRTEDFLAEVIAYLGQGVDCPPGERERRLLDLLSSGAPHLLVIDGLELVQAGERDDLARGELLDPALRRLLVALAEGRGQSRAVITTRFSPIDLEGHRGRGYRQIDLGPLSRAEAADMLAAYEVSGDVAGIVDRYGAHPLSIAMAGSYAREFLGGDGDKLAAVDLADAGKDDALARRLARLLESYAGSMSALERDVMARLSLFPAGATADLLVAAGSSPAPIQVTLARLCRLGILHQAAADRYTAHPFVRDHFRRYLTAGSDPVPAGVTLVGQPSPLAPETAIDELVAVFERTIAAGEIEAAYDLYRRQLGGFDHLGLARGDMVLGERLVRAFAPGGAVTDLAPALGAERSRAIAYDWGLYLGAQGELDAALACHEAAIDHAGQRPDALVVGMRAIAYITRLQGDLARSLRACDTSIELAARHGLDANLCRSLALRGRVLGDLGRSDEAVAAFDRLAELGDVPVARRGVWLAEQLLDVGDVGGAIAMTETNLIECERRRWPGHVAHCHLVLARAHVTRDPDRAGGHLAALDRWTSLTGEVELVLGGIEIAATLRRDDTAVRAGFELARRTGFLPAAARLACALLESAIRTGRPRRVAGAHDTARRAVALVAEHALVQARFAACRSILEGAP